ncbi:zf-CCHC domain-containing protein/UBN2 domain-containing protein [Gossypium australe]|uniref:Zf-CCHC domain-containing protein/UBN2 domain-containing protein n=1 Tax=Gossypium australe TaxID=47621 RepID=A0A5B6X0N2_9ROSI|nr:zf-CCHC domain-containing protein/UBN2 domain-containing protein [Gossypium australe]
MKPEEDMKEMSNRFTIAINGLKYYGKIYLNEKVVIGYLLTHEIRFNKGVEEEKVVKKKVGIALKSTINEDNESSEEVDEEKEMEMFARRFKRFMKSNKGIIFQKMEELKLESSKKKYPIICYECKKS